jgi:undecaprenyl-diphosphatase
VTWWEGVVLGVVQGVTEFLPISSSGHLVVTEAAIGLSTPGVLVEVTLHVATLLAVVFVYHRTLWRLVRGSVRGDRSAQRYVGLLAVGTVPAAAAGLFLNDFFERAFDSLLLVGFSFLVTGFVLWSTRQRTDSAESASPSVVGAGAIGLAQAFAILPGISRSGLTVGAGIWLGVDPVLAAEFSFLLAIPAIIGAAVLQIPELSNEIHSMGVLPLMVSFAAALASGVAAIRLLITLLKRRAFHRFAPYCWILGGITIMWALLRT